MRRRLNYDYAKFESIMEKEISNRKMLGNLSSSQTLSEYGIMDQFFLFGILPNKEKNLVPTIIAAFPPFRQTAIPIENVLKLSFPNWDFSNPKSKFSSTFSSSCDNGIVDEFVFQFNAGETKMYGVCSHIQPSKAIRSSRIPFFATESTKKNIFCMCLITKLPIFNTHFTFLNYLASLCAGTVLHPPKNGETPENSFENKYESDYRVEHAIQNDTIIEGLEITGTFGQISGITIPDEFQSKVFDYYSKTMYSSSCKLAPGYNIRFPPPTTPDQRLISWASLDTLFSCIQVRDVVELLAALILDAQVLIVGSSMQEVSMSVYGLYALLSPFKYCGIVMPIIPNDDHYLDLLSSPTPFIFGLPNIPKLKKMSFLESTYIVNIDKRKMPPVNYFPKYPNYATVVRNVSEIVASKDNTAFTPEDELLEINKGLKERSRSAIIALNTIPGTRQIRIKPNFSPSDRRNHNTAARISLNFGQNEKSANLDAPEKVGSNNSNEGESKTGTQGNLTTMSPFPEVKKPETQGNLGNTSPFPEVNKPEIQGNLTAMSPFPGVKRPDTPGNLTAMSPFPGIKTPDTQGNLGNTSPFPEVNKPETQGNLTTMCPFPEVTKPNTSGNLKTMSPFPGVKKPETPGNLTTMSPFPGIKNPDTQGNLGNTSPFPEANKPDTPVNLTTMSPFPGVKRPDTPGNLTTMSPFPGVKKPETPENLTTMSPFPGVKKPETPENLTTMSPFPEVKKPDTPGNLSTMSPFPGVKKPETPENLTTMSPFPGVTKPDTPGNLTTMSPFPGVKKLETPGNLKSACPFPEVAKPETPENSGSTITFQEATKPEASEKGESNENTEKLTVQFPNIMAIKSTPIRRRNTCMHIQFSPTVQTQSPSQNAPSSEPLCDFPTFNKPVVVNENDSNPYKFPQDFTKKLGHKVTLSKDSIDKIIDALHEPLETIFTDLLNCYFVTNSLENITIFNQSLFLASVKPEDLNFYEFLLESMTFQDYVETKLNEFTNSKNNETGQRRKSTYGPKTKRRASTVKKPFTS